MVRISAAILLIVSLAACNRGNQDKEAVRQGVVDYLANKAGLNVTGMDVTVSTVNFSGKNADATVSIRPKGTTPEQGMSMGYKLEQQGNKWVVVGRQDSGTPHGGAAVPNGMGNPHGQGDPSAMPGAPAGGAGKMPSPDDLPPAGKQK
jgi:hypothetical protein